MAEEEDIPELDIAAMLDLTLERDFANIVKKSAAGQPLNKREREMIEQERARQKKPATATEFQLDPVPSAFVNLTQPELAAKWGYSVRQIKNWIADGKKANDPAPLASPHEMPPWFARIYSPRTAPDRLIQAVRKISENQKTAQAATNPSQVEERIEISETEKGLLAMLDRFRTAEATMHRRFLKYVEDGEMDKADYQQQRWEKLGEKLRALEKSAPAALAEAGIYVRKDDVTRELSQIHNGIIKNLKQALRKARAALIACQGTDEFHRKSDEIVDAACTALCEDDFAEPLELEAG